MRPSPLHTGAGESSPLARELPARDYALLKIAIRDLINACRGARRASGHTRVGQPQLDRYASLDKPDEFMPADVVADLEAYCGVPFVTRVLAELSLQTLEPVPAAVRTADSEPLGRVTAKALKETSDVFGRLGVLMEDGVVTAVEDSSFAREVDEAIALLLTLKHQVHRQVELKR